MAVTPMECDTVTANGAPSFSSTGAARLNLYFKLTRDVTSNPRFQQWLAESWAEDPLDTLRLIFQARDCRGGKGDRKPFHEALAWVRRTHPAWFEAALPHVPFYGRYLDWVELHADAPSAAVVRLVCEQLRADVQAMDDGKPVSLLAKWLPTEGKKWDRKGGGLLPEVCRAYFGVAAPARVSSYHLRLLRKEVVGPLRAHIRLVERAMCAGSWDAIDFSAVPSVAMNRLKKAFARHDPERFAQWKVDLVAGKATVNSSQMDAHELVAQYMGGKAGAYGVDEVIEGQWAGLVEAVRKEGSLEHTLVLSDVSGSMCGVPMQVSVALGILISSCCCEHFRNSLITFEERPQFHQIPPDCTTLYSKVQSVRRMSWGGNTDLHAAMALILERARALGLRPAEMPRRLVILSDMQFDEACGQTTSQLERTRADFAAAGYPAPDVIFWNLRSDTTEDFPAGHGEKGVALLSGYRAVMLKKVISATGDLTPYGIMREAIDDPRYARIVAPAEAEAPAQDEAAVAHAAAGVAAMAVVVPPVQG